MEASKVPHAADVRESFIAGSGTAQVQITQAIQAGELSKASPADKGAAEVERLEACELCQVDKSGVSEGLADWTPHAGKVERLEPGETSNVDHSGVGYGGPGEIELFQARASHQVSQSIAGN